MSDAPAFHPAANLFPLMEESALGELAADIAAYGLREPIWRHRDGRIIDGRNRWLACAKVGVTCHALTYEGDDASIVPFVVSHNLHRRHLTESQRGLIAGEIATARTGDFHGNQWSPPSGGGQTSAAQSAEMLNVSKRTVERGAKVLKRGIPELADAVREQKISLNAAAEIASDQPKEQRRKLQDHLGRGGADKRQKGTPKMKGTETRAPKLSVVYDRDDTLADQVFSLIHRLREVAGKTTPAALRARMPQRLLHNLDISLEPATEFLIGLRAAHRAVEPEKKNAAV